MSETRDSSTETGDTESIVPTKKTDSWEQFEDTSSDSSGSITGQGILPVGEYAAWEIDPIGPRHIHLDIEVETVESDSVDVLVLNSDALDVYAEGEENPSYEDTVTYLYGEEDDSPYYPELVALGATDESLSDVVPMEPSVSVLLDNTSLFGTTTDPETEVTFRIDWEEA
ncbi:hypothetical protein [Haloarcula rara]|uniref:hypothetical protein n=1 Tax=Haloarcula rara TaxID=3033387 RepID=UPI0023E8A003|nr:hypothetical protein [Halomicroarcula sp. SHR3]